MFARAVLAALAIAVAAVAAGSSGEAKPPPPPPSGVLVGMNYTHHSFRACHGKDRAIIRTLHRRGVRRRVHRQLRKMRRRGVESLRTIVWHMRDTQHHRWGPVPSAGGRLRQPFRRNLRRYAKKVRRLGFARLTIAFGPQGINNPRWPAYDPATIEESAAFVDHVRAIVKRHGPRDTRFDLLNEGATSAYQRPARIRAMEQHVAGMVRRYAARHGTADVVVSVIGPERYGDRGNRLERLLRLLDRTGAAPPRWIELHLSRAPGLVRHGLEEARRVLARRGLDVPIVIGETSYDDRGVAAEIARFNASGGTVEEVMAWYKRPGDRCNVSPPYRVRAYRAALD